MSAGKEALTDDATMGISGESVTDLEEFIQVDKLMLAGGKSVSIVRSGCAQQPRDEQNQVPVLEGIVNGQKVQMLRDMGCNGVVIKKQFVTADQLTGEKSYIAMMNNTIIEAPIAKISI